MHRGIGIELRHQRHQISLRGVGRQLVFERRHAGSFGLLRLVANVDFAGRIMADKHHLQVPASGHARV